MFFVFFLLLLLQSQEQQKEFDAKKKLGLTGATTKIPLIQNFFFLILVFEKKILSQRRKLDVYFALRSL